MTFNNILAFFAIGFILYIFFFIIANELGGEQALFAIIGYLAGWGSAFIIYYTRKKPPSKGKNGN